MRCYTLIHDRGGLMTGKLTIAILAAGGATRFGGGKLDADLAGKPLGQHALDIVLGLSTAMKLPPPVIITPEIAPAFAREAAQRGLVALLPNPHAAEGLGTSVALAANHAIRTNASALLLVLADMPLISLGTLAHLASVTGCAAAVRHADGRPGIPACFPPAWLPELQRLGGEGGAGALLRERADAQFIDIAPHELSDVDTAEALEAVAITLSSLQAQRNYPGLSQ